VKRLISLVVIATFFIVPTSTAAVKKPAVKPLKLLTSIGNPDEFTGLVTTGKTIVIFGNKGDKSFARALDTNGKELWNLALDPASPSVATAATVDNTGTIWIAGSTSLSRATPAPSPTAIPLNPDKVVSVPDIFTADLDAFSLWSINPTTQALAQYTLQLDAPILINAIAADSSGLSAVGSSGTIINADLLGHISKVVTVGSTATTFEQVIKNADGTLTAIGSSTETLGGKKLVGKVDGVIIKISKANKIISLVRSSAAKAQRSWTSATSSLLLGGLVVTGSKTESAVTKFSAKFLPTWTYRFASTGTAFTAGSTFALIQSTGAISQLAGWSPKSPQGLLISFDSKGVINGGYSAPNEQIQLLGLFASKDLGILCITSSADTVSIFTLN